MLKVTTYPSPGFGAVAVKAFTTEVVSEVKSNDPDATPAGIGVVVVMAATDPLTKPVVERSSWKFTVLDVADDAETNAIAVGSIDALASVPIMEFERVP
jgi:hypothetical protein